MSIALRHIYMLSCCSSFKDSCRDAGHFTCCTTGECVGSSGSCHCDFQCHSIDDCCSDIEETCSRMDVLLILLQYHIRTIGYVAEGNLIIDSFKTHN